MSNRKIRVAVIGVGEIGATAHIPTYLRNERANLVALVDADETKVERIAKKFRIERYFSSVDDLFRHQDLDAISICTPPNTHAEIALKAMANDVHVLCEKPMATSANDAKKMFDVSRERGKILMIGFNLRFQPNYEKAKDLVSSGRLGQVYFAQCNLLSPNPLLSWSKSPWFFRPESGGGVLLDKGPHVFDLINYVLDDFPCAVSASSSTYFDSPVEDSCVCVLEYPENRIGIGIMSWLSSEVIESLSINGTSQSLFVSPTLFLEANATDIPEVSLWRNATKMLVNLKFPNFPRMHSRKVDTFQLEIDNFLEHIEQKKSHPTALSGLNVLITAEAAKKSLETGQRVDFTPMRN